MPLLRLDFQVNEKKDVRLIPVYQTMEVDLLDFVSAGSKPVWNDA